MKQFIVGLLVLTALAGCGGGPKTPEQITGTITSRDGMSVPPNASVHVELVKSTNGNESLVKDTTFQLTSQQAPIQFTLNLGDKKLEKDERYVVRAHVAGEAGQPVYTSPAGVPVTAATAANVEIIVASAGPGVGTTDTAFPGTDSMKIDSTRRDTTAPDTTRTKDTGAGH